MEDAATGVLLAASGQGVTSISNAISNGGTAVETPGSTQSQTTQGNSGMETSQESYTQWLKSIGAEGTTLQTLDSYHEAEYNNSPEYQLLKQYSEDVETGWISPLSGFENFKHIHSRIQNEAIGNPAVNGSVITGQSVHFMQRVIGTMADPKILREDLKVVRRSGVPVDDIMNTLFYGRVRSIRGTAPNRSQVIESDSCVVSVNPDTGILIQCNPFNGGIE